MYKLPEQKFAAIAQLPTGFHTYVIDQKCNGVRLPTMAGGMQLLIHNSMTQSLSVSPPLGCTLNNMSTNIADQIPTKSGRTYYTLNGCDFFTLLPSADKQWLSVTDSIQLLEEHSKMTILVSASKSFSIKLPDPQMGLKFRLIFQGCEFAVKISAGNMHGPIICGPTPVLVNGADHLLTTENLTTGDWLQFDSFDKGWFVSGTASRAAAFV